MQNLAELLADTDDRKAEQIAAILAGLDELDAYTGSRPHQCFSILMPFPVYLQFRGLNKKLRGGDCEEGRSREPPEPILHGQATVSALPSIQETYAGAAR